MSYTSVDYLKATRPLDLLKRLTDDQLGQTIDDALIQKIIDEVDALMNSYLQYRYNVPLSPVPEIVQKYASDIVMHYLWLRWAHDESMKAEYDEAIKWLQDIKDGNITLYVPTIEAKLNASINYEQERSMPEPVNRYIYRPEEQE